MSLFIFRKKFFWATTFFIFLYGLSNTNGQSLYLSHNQSLLDTAKKYIEQFCLNHGQSRSIHNRKIKYDKQRIEFLNAFYSEDLAIEEIRKRLNKFFKHKWDFNKSNIGAVTRYETIIYSEGNLEIFISFSTFANQVVFKRIYFKTKTLTDCLQPYEYGIFLQDLKYLEKNVIPIADFPFANFTNCYYISCDTAYLEKLKKLSTSEYHFFTSSIDNAINNITWFKADKYIVDNAVDYIAPIIHSCNKELLIQLLYSPNHILSIYAMEGLTYLKETGKIMITSEIQQKMEDVENSNIKITWQYSDVVKRGLTYKQLNISRQKIIAKYNN